MELSQDIHPKKKVLSLFTLVMINIIAVDSLRNLAISAEFGFSLIFFYIIAAIIFFIPIVVIAAELATAWPRIGGLYVWVREAFGKRWALVAIWLQWIYNVVWFPTILSFVAASLSQLIDPSLVENKTYMLSVVLIGFWAATLVNCFGMKVSGIISTLGAIIGTIFPMLLIIILGLVWLAQGNPSQIEFSTTNFFPAPNAFKNLAFFVAILFGLLGMEMSAVHAEDVKEPKKNYPRALLYSSILIFLSLVCSSLAIAVVIPKQEISLVSGLSDAFRIFFSQFNMAWMVPIINLLIILGALCSVSAWIIGPAKGLLAAAEDGSLPRFFRYTSQQGAPIILLFIQGIIFTLLCTIFLLMPTINSSYWVLSALTAQLAMFVYLFFFTAAIYLRYKRPDVTRTFKVPGKNIGIWLVGCVGILACIFAIIIGFFPPDEIKINNIWLYEGILLSGIVIFCTLPLFLYQVENK